ncbi:Pleckstrin homology domain-containing family A member 3 [Microtus ochrogaster]|uniref:Sesquipedalian n=1 Tax=Microtus ochrogaster TaxID=79684 RepID=A0A8J6GID5_MICOH|nr:Pleckstrin homology domain-containing family A member 3 [Microtus ochrogaster]
MVACFISTTHTVWGFSDGNSKDSHAASSVTAEFSIGTVLDKGPGDTSLACKSNVGWQPRWFVLDNGILSYYDSQDDVCKGSKGSIKMAVCEIKVHSADNTRMELIIPGEQHFYMKAVNAAERQRWLVALGSSKACLTDTRTAKEKEYENDLIGDLYMFLLEISETSESLKTKMSELRLYCDLLMQQVHTIQEFVHRDESRSSPSVENMNEASSLLSATCNTFITTLEDCVKIANAKFKPEMFQLPHPDPLVSPVSPSPVQMKVAVKELSLLVVGASCLRLDQSARRELLAGGGIAAPSETQPLPFTGFLSAAAEPTRTQTLVMMPPLKTQRDLFTVQETHLMEIWHQQPFLKKTDFWPRHNLILKNLFHPSPEEMDTSSLL